jgi:hypothetical protein
MVFVARFTKGRHKSSPRLSFVTYIKARTHLAFWAERSYRLRGLPSPQKSTLYNQLTEVMHLSARKYNISVQGVLNRTSVGLAELRQLIDHDMISTPSIELAECHHLAWCIGRICSVRPGSIGPPRKADPEKFQFLRWRDITITRLPQKGMFMVDINFRNLKTNTVDPDKAATRANPIKELNCRVMPPKDQEGLIFSIPHRLLTIALRRDLLLDIASLNALIDGDKYNIMVRKSTTSVLPY